MNTDNQSKTNSWPFTLLVPDLVLIFLPELFLYLSAIALATADPWGSVKSVVKIDRLYC
jgi:hypothetical protein